MARSDKPSRARDEGDLIDLLSQSAFQIMGVLTKLAADHDLSLTQLRVLAILRDRRVRMSDLVRHLGLDKSTLTGLVSRAEARGLLDRAPNENDRRAVDVFLSAAGRAAADQIATDLTERLSPMLHGLSPSESSQLTALLSQLLTAPAPQ